MPDIYEQHKAAFSNVSAFVILDQAGNRVATVAIKYPRDGAGRLYAYVHLIGVEMVRAHANGYGYDKRSAAVAAAIAKIPLYEREPAEKAEYYASAGYAAMCDGFDARRAAIQSVAPAMDSRDWTQALGAAGFTVLQAV